MIHTNKTTEEKSSLYNANGCQFSLFLQVKNMISCKGIAADLDHINTLLLNVNNQIGQDAFICGRGGNHIWISNADTKERLILIEYPRK